MKNHLLLFALTTFCVFGSANAQRGVNRQGNIRNFERNINRSDAFAHPAPFNRSNNFSFHNLNRREAVDNHSASSMTPIRQFPSSVTRNLDRDVTLSRPPQRVDNVPAPTRSFDRRVDQQRQDNYNYYDRPQTQRNVNVYNNRVVNNYRYGPSYRYEPRRYVYVGAPRYSVLPRGFFSVSFGGYPYYYHNGLFFGFYSGYYEPVFAPIGIHINVLPVGYYPFYIGPRRYYYYDGVYYSNYNDRDNEYEVVDARLGAQVSVLPKGATAATINGEKFYEFNGIYYKEGVNSKSEVVYTVVGKYGHVNNTDENVSVAARMGGVVPTLPDGCKELTIDGEQFYVSPSNTYYKAQTVDGVTNYKIVGTGSAKE